MKQRVVGIFDSGIGGLSVAREIKRLMPDVSLVYVADSDFAPYGDKSPQSVGQRCELICQFLQAKEVDAIVVACNTATVHHIERLRQEFNLPFVGVEPGIKPAVAESRNKRVGVWATVQTSLSPNLLAHVEKYQTQADIYVQACPGLAEAVEQLDLAPTRLIDKYLSSLVEQDVDQLVLGCTHYSFVIDAIRQRLKSSIEIVDTGNAVAKQLVRLLSEQTPLFEFTDAIPTTDTFYSSGEQAIFDKQLLALWPNSSYISDAVDLNLFAHDAA